MAQNYKVYLGYTAVPTYTSFASTVLDGWNLIANPFTTFYDRGIRLYQAMQVLST